MHEPWRLRNLPRATVCGCTVPVAATRLSRLLGLALLHRERAGAGLLIPSCHSVHTFGMRFRIDVIFVDATRLPLGSERGVGSRRVLTSPEADAVLEVPA
jgi:uncharacterized protein